ncbi:MAG: A/G-specific adenine glycosylase [Albidovulum sp.]|nr:A/G-specific adenine glycosylase [Albidovulum sp.]MDE0308022.1 A/G-specific adenine glycosylase [Albidovulum sp.]MDE0533273.1 A/G-specific adenine glycosylase [Albidovulum sp.]
MTFDRELGTRLLAWYDINARILPWRIGPVERRKGAVSDPYSIWVSEIMLQQTTTATVKNYFPAFIARWPTIFDLAAAEDADVLAEWAGLGYYARARRLIECARLIVDRKGGVFPKEREELLSLPGIGPYTAAAIAAIAFDRPETVVDGNVERIMARLHVVRKPLAEAKKELREYAAKLTPSRRPGDYAQAVMDLGATVCRPLNPACRRCPWQNACLAYSEGLQNEIPPRLAKSPKPVRRGTAYVGMRKDGAWLLERRPGNGLLGGMLGWPGSKWNGDEDGGPPCDGAWTDTGEIIRHIFTHFELRLRIVAGMLPEDSKPEKGNFISKTDFNPAELPAVMRKAYNAAAPYVSN